MTSLSIYYFFFSSSETLSCSLFAQGKRPCFVGLLPEHEHCSRKKRQRFFAARFRRPLSNDVPEYLFVFFFFLISETLYSRPTRHEFPRTSVGAVPWRTAAAAVALPYVHARYYTRYQVSSIVLDRTGMVLRCTARCPPQKASLSSVSRCV